MTRVAAVDCGTNSVRLLLAESDERGALVDLDRRLEIVRLGQGIDATGEFHPDALTRTFAAVDRYAEVIRAAGIPPERTRFVATSAARDAGNRDEFFAGVRSRLGVEPEVISGETEASLSFSGALSRISPAAEPVLVMDIGGGSTELVLGTATGRIASSVSLDLGSVRLTERYLHSSPPEPAELAEAQDHVDALLRDAPVDLSSVGSWIGVAGTVTSLAAMHLGLADYDSDRVHGSTIPAADVTALLAQLSRLPVSEIRSIASMHPQRADVITAGALIAARVGAALGSRDLLVSESDILDGIALDLLHRGRRATPGRPPKEQP